MGKPHVNAVNRYNAKTYDRISLMVPRGRKEEITQFAKERGETVLGFINRCIREKMGVSEAEWKG